MSDRSVVPAILFAGGFTIAFCGLLLGILILLSTMESIGFQIFDIIDSVTSPMVSVFMIIGGIFTSYMSYWWILWDVDE